MAFEMLKSDGLVTEGSVIVRLGLESDAADACCDMPTTAIDGYRFYRRFRSASSGFPKGSAAKEPNDPKATSGLTLVTDTR